MILVEYIQGSKLNRRYFFAALVMSASAFGAQEPLFVRSQAMAQFFRYSPHPLSFQSLETGETKFKAGRTMSNYWGRDEGFIIDGQTIDDSAQIRMGLFHDVNMSIEFGSRRFTNIKMDDVAITFHDVFMIPQDKRTTVRRNGTRVAAPDYGLEITEENLFDPVSEQVGIKFEKSNFRWGDYQIAGSWQYTYETSEGSLIKEGAKDWGLQLGFHRDFLPIYSYGVGSFMVYDGYKDAQLYLRGRQSSLLLGIGYSMEQKQDLIFQALITESAYRDIGQLSRASYEVHLGYRKFWQNIGLEFNFIENIFWPFNSPDWGVNLNMIYTFKG